MAAIGNKYDQNAAPAAGFDTMPEHECVAQIIESDYKATKAGTGHYIWLKWQLIDGPHKGRFLFDNLNVDNPNKTASDIGNAQFAAVRVALFGSKDKIVNDTVELQSIPCRIKVGIQTDKATKQVSNVIKKYVNLNATPVSAAMSNAAPWSQSKAEENF